MTAVLDSLDLPTRALVADPLLVALHRLDHLLEAAVARAQADPAGEDARAAPAAPLLYRPSSESDGSVPDGADARAATRLDWLAYAFGLDPFELDLVILALAPEVDRRYERYFAYLLDDATARRPTIGLALDLFCQTTAERIARRRHFTAAGALVAHQLLTPFSPVPGASLLNHPLALDAQIVSLLLGADAPDARLARWCRFLDAERLEASPLPRMAEAMGLPTRLRRAVSAGERCTVYLSGAAGSGKLRLARALAAAAGAGHVTIDVAALLASDADVSLVLALALRDAWLRNAIPYLRGVESVWREESGGPRLPLATLLADHAGPVILGGRHPWVPGTADLMGVTALAVEPLDAAARRRAWQTGAAAVGLVLAPDTLDTLATRFRLAADEIAEASATAATVADDAPEPEVARAFLNAARAARGHELGTLATRIPTVARWESLVLPDESLAQLREICQRVMWRERVLETWGFRERLSRGHGVTVLFAGASGTGKTLAAEVLASELGLDLYRVELAGVVSKYIGETEKNLDRIFAAAEHSNAILLFDEADALFGKRSEVKDAHDRYANLEVSYLLQRMESYEGVAILATNLRGNLDAAFVRRLAFTVTFPFPDATSRRQIWEGIWPAAVPLAPDVDFAALAERFPLSGGNIRNIALAAAFLAAEAGSAVAQAHLIHATAREYEKLGKTLSPEERG